MKAASIGKIFTQLLLVAATIGCSKATTEPRIQTSTNPPLMNNDTNMYHYLALGDSYTIGESVEESSRYPVITAAILKAQGTDIGRPDIIARTGWTTANLQDAINETEFEHNYDIVTLLIGVNNQYQGGSMQVYRKQFEALVVKAISLAGDRKERVVVLSIPDYSVTPFGQRSDPAQISAAIDQFNKANKELAETLGVHYIDITTESREALNDSSMVASDNLHFSGKMYRIWAEKMAPVLKNILNAQ